MTPRGKGMDITFDGKTRDGMALRIKASCQDVEQIVTRASVLTVTVGYATRGNAAARVVSNLATGGIDMKRMLGILLATALLGGCVIVPPATGIAATASWRGYRDDHYDRYDRYDRHDGGWHRDGRGWRDGDDRGR